MSDSIIIIDTSEVLAAKGGEVERAMRDLATFVEANEPRAMAYNAYFHEAGTRMTVVQVHPDSASAEHHLRVAAPAFRQFSGLLRLLTMDVYGAPSQGLLALLRSKARMLGAGDVAVHRHHAGFIRARGS
jgi:hypothetical protein